MNCTRTAAAVSASTATMDDGVASNCVLKPHKDFNEFYQPHACLMDSTQSFKFIIYVP